MIGRWAQRFATAIERPAVAYGVALAAVAVAVGLREVAGLFMRPTPNYMPFYPAVLFAAFVAGGRGGLLALGASVAVIWTFWVRHHAPAGELNVQHGHLILFAITGAATVGLAKAIRVAVRRGVDAEERFRIAQHASRDGFVIMEPIRARGEIVDFRWAYANPAADRMAPSGTGGGLTGRTIAQVFDPDTASAMVARLTPILETGGPDDIEVRRIIDGKEHWMRSSAVRLRDSVAVTFRDVTDQRAADQALKAGAAQVRAVMESLPQVMWSSRPDGYCDYLSPQWSKFTGVAPKAHRGRGWLDAVHPEDRDDVAEAWDQAMRHALPFDMEYRLRRQDGAWRWFNGRASAVRDEAGGITRWFGAASDITEIVEARHDLEVRVAERTRELKESLEDRARAEAALAQAQRLETVGRLTGGVAHDFNNLLTVVIGGLDMILRAPQDTARVTRLAEAALSAGRRGERLTRQLLAFSRRQELKFEVVDLYRLIEQIEPLIRRAVGEALDLSVTCAPDIGASRVDAAQFESALLNLVVNASDATPAGGQIRVQAERVALAAGEVQAAQAGDYVRVAVSDTGEGMSPEVLERVFEPFFTTKEVGKGTGLGLAQVYGFVSQCGGVVSIDSALGQGTTISLYLPATAEAPAALEDEARPTRAAAASGARVLLVEDDVAVRAMTETLLSDLGCKVAAEADGAAALKRLETGERFDLVISDIVMPGGMTGVDLAKAARAQRPGLPIILTTGYAGQQTEIPADLDWPVLRKPFRSEQLEAMVQEVLAPTPA